MKNLVAAQRRYDREESPDYQVDDEWDARITPGVRREIVRAVEMVSKTRVDAAAAAETIPPV